MGINFQSPLDPILFGIWRSVQDWADAPLLRFIEPRFAVLLALNADGSADYHYISTEGDRSRWNTPPPIEETWEVTQSGVLTIDIPIAPQPEHEIFDWIKDAMRFDVISINEKSMILSDCAHDGESIILYCRDPKRET